MPKTKKALANELFTRTFYFFVPRAGLEPARA